MNRPATEESGMRGLRETVLGCANRAEKRWRRTAIPCDFPTSIFRPSYLYVFFRRSPQDFSITSTPMISYRKRKRSSRSRYCPSSLGMFVSFLILCFPLRLWGSLVRICTPQCAQIWMLFLEFSEEAFKTRGGADDKLWRHVF